MNPSRILPDLQCSLLCEDVRQEVTGNFILAGVLSFIRVPQVPVTAYRLWVFNRWAAGVGQFVEEVRLVAPDQTTVIHKGQSRFALENPAQNITNFTLLRQVQFPAQGVYFIEVLIDDVMKIRYPLPVVVVPPPAAAGAGATGAAGAASPPAGGSPPSEPGAPAQPGPAPAPDRPAN